MPERNASVTKKKARGPSRIVATGNGMSASTSGKTVNPSKYGFLHWQHPVYLANKDQWLQNEELLYGGHLALEYLRPFEWEMANMNDIESPFWWRKTQATYPNLPDKFTTLISAHLYRSAPRPDNGLDFGTLGKINDTTGKSQASSVFYSCDHPGLYGTNWDAWWQQTLKRAMATGHRWIFINGPPKLPQTKKEERFGSKPYLVEFSPLVVPNWYFDHAGNLEFCVVELADLDPKMEKGSFTVNGTGADAAKMLLVRKGCTRLGPEFSSGGWWIINKDEKVIDNDTFDDTDGDIPMFPYFSEPHKGLPTHPAMSRPQTSELGNCAISMMNITSAANFDAWDRAMGIEWLRGVDLDAWNLAMEKQREGSRWLPLTPHAETDSIPEVTASKSGADSSLSYEKREQSLWTQAQWIGIQESVGGGVGGNTAAGANADFSATQMPRIIQIALQTMAAQNMAIFYLERRFGNKNPTGQALWPTKYNLVELADRVKAFFESERLSGLRCTPLDTEAMIQLGVEKGLIANEEEKTQYREAFLKYGEMRDKAIEEGGKEPGDSQDPNTTAKSQAKRLADDKVTDGSKGTPGRPAPSE